MTYKIIFIFDCEKPEQTAETEEELREKLKAFYYSHRDTENYAYIDVFVFDGDKDITESQFIEEIVGDIVEAIKWQ